MTAPRHWQDLAQKWPNADHSRFVRAAGLDWHVQRMGNRHAPGCLLVHGTGASTHSWARMMPMLAKHFDTLAIDLPGHGFTSEGRGRTLTLPGMAAALAALLEAEDFSPSIAVGHSAGAAILIEMDLTGAIRPMAVVSLNGALEPIEGNAILAPLAKALFLSPLTAHAVAMQARYTPMTRRLLERTNSTVDADGIAQYEALVALPSHVAGALGMMANWDLDPLQARLPEMKTPLFLIANQDDPMVPAAVSQRVARSTDAATVMLEPTGGHVAHETEPAKYAAMIEAIAADTGALERLKRHA